jgi:hypothetical protein
MRRLRGKAMWQVEAGSPRFGRSLTLSGLALKMLCIFNPPVMEPYTIQSGQKCPEPMNNSISKAAYAGLGHCSVCGIWTKLEMWDEGLNGRFCSECFDHVVDAAELLASQGLTVPGPELKQKARNV